MAAIATVESKVNRIVSRAGRSRHFPFHGRFRACKYGDGDVMLKTLDHVRRAAPGRARLQCLLQACRESRHELLVRYGPRVPTVYLLKYDLSLPSCLISWSLRLSSGWLYVYSTAIEMKATRWPLVTVYEGERACTITALRRRSRGSAVECTDESREIRPIGHDDADVFRAPTDG